MDYSAIELIDNTSIHNFEMFVEGERAFIDYEIKGHKIYLIHTDVPPALQGKGLAAALVEKAFDCIEQHQLKLVPMCTYVKHFLALHPEWDRLLA